MMSLGDSFARRWTAVGMRYLPFADAATTQLPLGRLLRLSLFQVSVGMAAVLLIGTLNRVMIVELGVAASLVGVMVALPLVFAPLRTLIGHFSDHHRSLLGWRRVPYIWMGTMLQFGGLAIMPFALILLSGDSNGPAWIGHAAAVLAFLLVGAGLHTTQTVGLALATDLAPEDARPRVVALLCTMLLVGMVASALVLGMLLANFSQVRLIQVVQGSAVVTLALNLIALWKQEARNPALTSRDEPAPAFAHTWAEHVSVPRTQRRLTATALGTAGFSMQDILLEPYGGQILHLPVAATTGLTAVLAAGGIVGLVLAARRLAGGRDPHRICAEGALAGLAAFSAVIFSAPLQSPTLFAIGVATIGFGGGLFAHGTLTAAMTERDGADTGFALGVWGTVQATAAGLAIAAGGLLRDAVASLAMTGRLGEGLAEPATGYSFVYHVEIGLLFAALVALGPLVRPSRSGASHPGAGPGLAGACTLIDQPR